MQSNGGISKGRLFELSVAKSTATARRPRVRRLRSRQSGCSAGPRLRTDVTRLYLGGWLYRRPSIGERAHSDA